MVQSCKCSQCGGNIAFDDSDFYTLRHDYFKWYGPTVTCPHCAKPTEVFIKRPIHPIFNIKPVTWLLIAIPIAMIVLLMASPDQFENLIMSIFKLALLAAVIALYFLPTIIGSKKRNVSAIFIINLFLGWTLVGWVLTLAWSTTDDK